ncbi:L-lactate dehydrogenase [Enterococcus termitis]|uniref:L-lactate dehydrogenase n=1 Tax=Enterococcus termitis TaxID=332950 RepID=A0A1E5GB81_9ENTE|nr:L-lactate dehydrogenase [Enterococcus termitis]OEG09949.1 L-lactate dehydrogenase [Enterococcus termitis]OJG98471.1 L-lactate dehydrogenase [Enterococcus termitis]
MHKVGIIGLGHVGATLAYSLVTEGLVDELVLIDKDEQLAVSQEYDLLDAQVFLPTKTAITIQDYHALKNASILVFCAGQISALGDDGDRFKELEITREIVEETVPKIKESGFDGIILSITNPCDVIVSYLQKLTGFAPSKVIGTGTMLDTARMKQAVGKKLSIDSGNIGGYVYGEHGDSQFVAWSTVTVGDQPILAWNQELDLAQLDEDVRDGGWKSFAGKGFTSYGIASCAIKMIRMILKDTKVIVSASVYDESSSVYYGRPAIIGKNGVESLIDYPLNELEQSQLMRSLEIIDTGLKKLL